MLGWQSWEVQLVLVPLLLNQVSGRRPLSAQDAPVDLRVACALGLTRSQLSDTTHIVILGRASWLQDFLEAADVPVTLLELGAGQAPVHNLESDVVFLVTDGDGYRSFVEEALTQARRHQVLYSGCFQRVVAWWRSGDSQAAVDVARDMEVVRLALVSGSSGEPQRVSSYREDCVNGTVTRSAALPVGRCGETGLLSPDGADLFLDLRSWNFQGCPLFLRTSHVPPFRELVPQPEGGYTLRGIYAPLAHVLAKHLNATLKVKKWSVAEQFGGLWGSGGKQEYNQRDLSFGFMLRTVSSDGAADLSPSYFRCHYSFFVPSGLGGSAGSFDLVHRELTPTVWMAVGTSYLSVIAVLWWCWRDERSVQDVVLFTLSSFLGNVVILRIDSLRARMLTMLWLMFCIVLTTAYHAVRHSLVVASARPLEILTLRQLLDSELTVVGFPVPLKELKVFAEDRGDAVLLAISERSQVVTDLEKAVLRMAIKKDIAIFFESVDVTYFAARLEVASGTKLVHEAHAFLDSATHFSFFVARRGSRLSPALVDTMTRALDVGLLDKLESLVAFRRPEFRHNCSRLSLDNLSAAFKLLLIGLAAGGLVFLVEILAAYTV